MKYRWLLGTLLLLTSIRIKQQRGDAIKPSETGRYRRIKGRFFPSRPVTWRILVIRRLIAFIYKHVFELTSPMTYESRLIPVGVLWANLPADFDNDGDVDFSDFVAFAGKFGTNRGDELYEEIYDINRDGAVDLKDYLEFAAEFGNSTHSDKHALTPDELEALAKAHLDNGNYEQAVKEYLSFIAQTREPAKRARGRKDLGMTYLKMNRLGDASEQFRTVLSTYKGSDIMLIRHQLLWSSIGLSEIASKQGNEQALVLYLAQATVFLPN